MASNSITSLAKFSSIVLLTFFICSQAELGPLKETTMTVYFQDYYDGPNATLVPVTGRDDDGVWSFGKFGTIFCTDDQITEGKNGSSAEIGKGQGMYITSALDGSNTLVLISIVFTNEEYKGSTLEVQGSSAQFEKIREVTVVSGTGKFRFARGYATLETVHLDTSIFYSVIECNITVVHY